MVTHPLSLTVLTTMLSGASVLLLGFVLARLYTLGSEVGGLKTETKDIGRRVARIEDRVFNGRSEVNRGTNHAADRDA